MFPEFLYKALLRKEIKNGLKMDTTIQTSSLQNRVHCNPIHCKISQITLCVHCHAKELDIAKEVKMFPVLQ